MTESSKPQKQQQKAKRTKKTKVVKHVMPAETEVAETPAPTAKTITLRKRHIALPLFCLLLLACASYSYGRWGNTRLNLGRLSMQNVMRPSVTEPRRDRHNVPTAYDDLRALQIDDEHLQREQLDNQITSVDMASTPAQFRRIEYYFATANPVLALWLLDDLRTRLKADDTYVAQASARMRAEKEQATKLADQKAQRDRELAAAAAANGTTIPILMYHKTPSDFEAQLNQLRSKGYTTITMAQVACGLRKACTLPSKPAVITFDDGFSDQQKAFKLLQKYGMHATYYLIIGGDRSKRCIGIERNQSAACGDSYMNWDEARVLAGSGLIEIGAHTMDHLNLASLNEADQSFQIVTSKQRLEQELGIAVTTLAYPYGSFNAASVRIAQQAGFSTAVSTIEGTVQSKDNIYTLRRVRSTYKLP